MDLCFLKSAAAQAASYAVALRREIHSHPELSDREEQTSALVCRELERLNIPYTVLPGMHGVVGMISSGREGPTVALRADMDALPIQEQTGLAFASQKEGVMHACGHDVHTAVLLGTASVLAENKALFRGNVKLFFQPAEEGVGGAKRMIAAGCMENPHVEAVFGLHSAPRLPAGKIGTKPGWTSASSDEIKIRVHGKSAHGASPDEGVDAIYIASQLVVALYGLMARRVRGTDSIALNVGKFHAGNANNIICECAELEAMYRTFRADTRQRMKQEICDLVHSLCKGFGGWAEITIEEGYDGHANDADRTRRLMELSRELMGEDAFVLRETPDMGTEDFCYFGQKAPAVFFDLGTGSAPGHPVMPLHSSRFTVDEDALYYGILMEAALALDYLSLKGSNRHTLLRKNSADALSTGFFRV